MYISMYIGLPLDLQYGRLVPFIKSNCISEKLTTFRLALVVNDNPHSLNTQTLAFPFL